MKNQTCAVKILGLAGILAVTLNFAACSHKAQSRVKKGEILKTIDTTEAETDRYLEFDGIGAADQSLTNMSQRRSLSEAAGRRIAEEKLLAYLKGQQIDSTTTVEQAITTDQNIKALLNNTIRGVSIVKREWTSDDGCVVTIRLDKKKFKDQLQQVGK